MNRPRGKRLKRQRRDKFFRVASHADRNPRAALVSSEPGTHDDYLEELAASFRGLLAECRKRPEQTLVVRYEDLIRDTKKTTLLRGLPEKKAEAMAQLIDAIQALMRENKETLWGSMVKQTMTRKNPAFNESYYGYSTFSKLLEDAAKQKIVTLEKDAKSGTYIITSVEEGRAA